jgi:predicted metal-dependent peptidase
MAQVDMNDPVVKAIVGARVKLLLEKPFFGTLATRLEMVDGSKWCKTAATDGRKLYYNREFVKAQSMAQLLFLCGHEVLHCVYDHLGRRGSRDPKIWNMANDYIVNYTLIKEGVGKMPDGGLYDERYTDMMTSEEVYDLLIANSTTVKMTLDEHINMDSGGDGDDEGNGDGDGNTVEVRVMGKDGPPKLTEDDLNQIRNEIRAATLQAAQAVGAGKTPAGVRRLIDAFTKPKMDWRQLLETHIKSTLKDDYTFQRVNRRTWSGGGNAVFPGMSNAETIDIAISIDTSGSMTDDMLRDFLGEVKGIMEMFSDFKITLWTFDCSIHNPQVFTMENLDDILTYDPKGGGGTTFEVNWEYMKDNDIMPQRFVMFTDGYPNMGWGDPDYVDTLFVMHGTTSIVAPFGISTYYEEKPARK